MTSKVDTRNLTHKQKEQKDEALQMLAKWKMTPEARAHFEDEDYWEESQAEALAKLNKAGVGGGNGDARKDGKANNKVDIISVFLKEIKRVLIKDLFVDNHDVAFAATCVGGHLEILPIKGNRFKRWISKLFYDMMEIPIKADALKQIIDLLQAQALFSGIVKNLQLRTSGDPVIRDQEYNDETTAEP